MAPRIQHITMIGLGAMGTAMANLLLKAGYEVTGFDVLSKRMTALVPRGLKRAKSLRDAVATAELIMLSLPNWDIVAYAYLLDLEDSPSLSNKTFGIRINGSNAFSGRNSTSYTVDYAHQENYGDNPNNYSADYILL